MRKAMVEPRHSGLSVRAQCKLLGVNRNRLTPKSRCDEKQDLELMKLLDRYHLDDPSAGARRMKEYIRRDHGLHVSRRRIQRLMNRAGIRACGPRPRTSIPGKGHKIYPYLLREEKVEQPDEAWCSDITYIPMARGFCYLCAVMDWHSRAVLGWAVSNTMSAGLCVEAFDNAVRRTGRTPEIMNTDQGSQFTGGEWARALHTANPETRISMDGKGRWVDNVFIERLWRSVKYEDVYLRAYENLPELQRGLDSWFTRYNHVRPHRALDGAVPWECYLRDQREAA